MAYPLTDADKAYLEQLAAQSPPLTPEQRGRLRPILAGTLDDIIAARVAREAGSDAPPATEVAGELPGEAS